MSIARRFSESATDVRHLVARVTPIIVVKVCVFYVENATL